MIHFRKKGTYFMAFGRFDEEGFEFLGKIFVQWKNTRSAKIDYKTIEILKFFIDRPVGSPYQCHKYMNEDRKIKISYKSVNQKINKIYRLGFIRRNILDKKNISKNNRSKHNAQYFKLSPFGIFYVFCKKIIVTDQLELHPNIILNNENLTLYRNLLFPHVPLYIIKELKSEYVWYSILKYIHNCCYSIEDAFVYISKQDYIIDSVEKIGGLLYCTPTLGRIVVEEIRLNRSFSTLKEIEDPDTMNNVKKRYELVEELVTIGGEEILKVSSKGHYHRTLFFKIHSSDNKEKKILMVYENEYENKTKPKFETEIDTIHNNIGSMQHGYVPLNWKELIKCYFETDYLMIMTQNLINLFIDVTSLKYDIIMPTGRQEDVPDSLKILYNDLVILKRDPNFIGTFYNIKEHIEGGFNNFHKLIRS